MVCTYREHSPETNENTLTNAVLIVIGEKQTELEVNSPRQAGKSGGEDDLLDHQGAPSHRIWEQPTLTLWPLLRVPRISAGPQSGMA